ncbi:MAG: class I poly(R)-hydroxyalkanoic acid synthase [Caulobacterales bacterium 32-69-10]|nr:MAG: class I poly(R)-hydroxyalkanoic acid synthase [Caulobacterales bacterium 32-69-10]
MALKAGGRGRSAKIGKPDWSKRARDRKAKTDAPETAVEAAAEVISAPLKAKAKRKAAPTPPLSQATPDSSPAKRGSRKAKVVSPTNVGEVAAKQPEGASAPPPKSKTKPKAPPAPLGSAESPSPPGGGKEAAPPQSESAPSPSPPFDPTAFLAPEQREALERLSLNLARAAMTAQGAVAEAALRHADRPAALSPDPFKVGPALQEVMGSLAANPDKLIKAQGALFSSYMELWGQASRRMAGEAVDPVVEPARGDRRFNDPDWKENPVFEVMKQSYLLTANWLNDLVASVEGVDPLTKRRVEFFTKLLTDAFSPTNFLISNPAALREAIRSQGESLVKGAERFAADLERGGGKLSITQADAQRFKVGENVATAPGKVVFENELFQLLQFSPSTDQVFEVPLLIFPPWINKYYILDLRPENSMIRWLTSQGFTVFVTSWVNPDAALAGKTLEDYMTDGAYAAVDAVLRQTGAKQVNAVGYCIGGTLLSVTLAHMAAKKDRRIASATFFAAQSDFSEAGDLLIFTNEEWLSELEARMDAAGGVLPGAVMADTFNALRANDLIWSFFVSNYLMGKEPAAFDLLFWNADQTRMPKTLHLSYLREFYKSNRLAKGELEIGGVKLDLKAVKTPLYVQSSREDHIAPMRSVYRSAKLFGGPVTYTLAGSGHIAGVINHPGANKYQHWINGALPATVEDWLGGAKEQPGSWWPHWADWLAEYSGKLIPARDPAKGALKAIEDAPGRYVKVRSDAA